MVHSLFKNDCLMTKKGATHHEQPLYSIQALGMSMLTSS